jgi:pimeloyl-ACP methyl ester carboxylesterase
MAHTEPGAGEGGRRRESVRTATAAGAALAGTFSYAETPGKAAVLFLHGFGSVRGGAKAEAVEAACARRGWTFAAFDFRGHGDSEGRLLDLRGSSLQEDLDAVYAFLLGRGVGKLYPVGSSLGGWAAAWFALRRPEAVAAAVFVAPALRFPHGSWERLTDAQREEWRRTGRLRVRNQWLDVEVGYGLAEERDHFPEEALAAGWLRPLLIFHGMRDDTTPYADSLAFVERTACTDVELRLLKDGDHRLLAYKEEMAEAACAFFARRGFPRG